VFAAGIVLWELCAGRRLYRGTEEQMLELARRADVPPLPDRGLPRQDDLAAILDTALARDPEERWPNAGAMLRALDDYAMSAKLFASQIRFGTFLSEHFEKDVVDLRRERESAAELLDRAPLPPVAPVPDAPSEQAIRIAAQDTVRMPAVTFDGEDEIEIDVPDSTADKKGASGPLVAMFAGAIVLLAAAILAYFFLRG
jgi:serine/threonine protein kinase